MPKRDEPAADALAKFGARYRTRREALDAQQQALKDERDAAIRTAFAAGMTTRDIASVLGGISHQRVAQIVQQR